MTRRAHPAQASLFDLFAPPAPPPVLRHRNADGLVIEGAPPPPTSAPEPDDEEEGDELLEPQPSECGADRSEREAQERMADYRRMEAAPGETFKFGDARKNDRTPFGACAYTLRVIEDGGVWKVRGDLSVHNMGSSGPFWGNHASRDEAILYELRKDLMRAAASAFAMRDWGDQEHTTRWKHFERLTREAFETFPPLLIGVDLAGEFEPMKEASVKEETARRAMLMARHTLNEQADAVLRENKLWGYGQLICADDEDSRKPCAHDARFPGRYEIEGEDPDQLHVVVYAKPDRMASPAIVEAHRLLAAALPVPVTIGRCA